MNRIKAFVLSFLCAFVATKTFSQTEIPVNLFSGAPGVSVSLGGIGGHGVYNNVALAYSTEGLTLQGRGGEFGMGWNLVGAGGGISREVRGLPDEYSGASRIGWLWSQCNVNVGNFTVSSDNNLSVCTDEAADYNFINGLATGGKDSEPDIFRYSVPGASGAFVFDNSTTPSIRLIPYADIKIDVQFVGSKMERFVITTNDGSRYVFDTEFKTARYSWPDVTSGTPKPVYFESTDFNLYNLIDFPEVAYTYEWALDSAKSVSGGYLYYQYFQKDLSKEEVAKYESQSDLSFDSFGYSVGYNNEGFRKKRLLTITSSSGAEVKFIYNNELLSEVVHNDYRKTGSPFVKRYTIKYDRYKVCSACDAWPDFDGGSVDTTFRWSFVKSVTEESSCSKLPPYEFTYVTPQKYPAPVRTAYDAWGYYNYTGLSIYDANLYVYPSLPPQERYRIFAIDNGYNYGGVRHDISMRSALPQADSAKIGVIQTVKFPAGGSATIDWELHEFYDSLVMDNYEAGGLRVKKITYSDGTDPLKNLVTEYVYKIDGKSTGKLLMQPKFNIPTDDQKTGDNPLTLKTYSTIIQQGGNPWTLLSRLTSLDLTGESTSVVYSSVKVSKAGQGYVISEFTTPATWGKSVSGEWEASTVKIARSAPCNPVDFITTGTYNIYPYPTNPDYSFAQGLPASERVYSEQGTLLRETKYTYKPIYKGTATHKVWGLRYEKVPYWTNGYLFSKYFLLTDAGRVISTVTTKEFDAGDVSRYVQTSASYDYESGTGPHRLLKKIEQTHTDGSKTTQYFKYPPDFGTIQQPAAGAVAMIDKLQQSFRNGTPLETRTTVTIGGTEKTVAASTSILDGFGGTKPLTKHMLSLKAVGLTDFVPASIQNGALIVDSRYDTITTVLSYSPYLEPLSVISDDRINRGSIKGYNNTVTVASISNALPEQMAFSDFETTTTRSFDASAALTMGAPRSGTASIQLTSTVITLSKQFQRGGDQYILSGWLLKNQNVTLNLRVKNVAKTQTYHSQSISFTAGGSKFEYFENNFPIDASLTDFVVEIECTVPTPGTPMPLLDDITVYPAQADIGSSTFDIPFGATSTTSRDRTGYAVYDDLGRLSVSKDRDGNILQKNTYYFPGMQPAALAPSISFPSPVYVGTATAFTARTNTCLTGVTFQWDFGSGYVNGTETMTNTFTTVGQKTVKVKMTHSSFGTIEHIQTVDVILSPDQTAHFTYTPVYGAGSTVKFIARDNSSLGTVTYEWDFGQGYQTGTREIDHTITASGPVFLRVSSNNPAALQQVYKGIVLFKSSGGGVE